MEYLKELKEIYKDVKISKGKGIQTEEDLHLVMKSTQLSKDMKREIITLWRQDPIHKLEEKYGKETLQRVFIKKKDEMCEDELKQILYKYNNDAKINLLNENINRLS